MFRNFIYFIIVLLIYTTYQPSGDPNFPPLETVFLFLCSSILFAAVTWAQFRWLEIQASRTGLFRLDHKFNLIMTRQSILAIALFAFNVYGLNLSSILEKIPLFSRMPTLQAVAFLMIFIGYLSLIWYYSHSLYIRLYSIDISRASYISSNILFAVPVLLPWFFLSIIADIIHALPFQIPKQVLATTEGQVAYFLVFLFGASIFGPALVQKFWGCKPLEPGIFRNRIEQLCQRAGIRYADILYWPIFGGRMITAGVMGLSRKFRYILVTDALLRFLAPEEIDAVIAHEIGHVKRKHLVFYVFFFVGYLLLSYAVFDLIIFMILYSELTYRFIDAFGFHQATVISILFSVVVIFLFLFYFRYIFGYFMRNFERQADAYVYRLFGSARSLISTLEKIALTTGQPADRPNWHHFSIAERIGYLQKCELDRNWVRRHDGKVRRSIGVYLTGILLVAAAGYQLNFGEAGKMLNAHFYEKILENEIRRTPENARLFSMRGDLHYSRKEYSRAIESYEQAIRLKPESPQVLNNLAWLYATCPISEFRNPVRAMHLAERAAAMEQSSQIMDTLAESYFVNGYREAAISAGKRALELAAADKTYFRDQLKKFSNGSLP
jgi:Zn-dependent protease with chaperone function